MYGCGQHRGAWAITEAESSLTWCFHAQDHAPSVSITPSDVPLVRLTGASWTPQPKPFPPHLQLSDH